MKMGVTSI